MKTTLPGTPTNLGENLAGDVFDLSKQWLEKWQTLVNCAAIENTPATANPLPLPVKCNRIGDREASGNLDRSIHAAMARATLGISPASMALAYLDWAVHLAVSPGKWLHLAENGARQWGQFANYSPQACMGKNNTPCIGTTEQDKRFKEEAWQHWPFNVYSQAFLLQQQWWQQATTGIAGVSAHDEQVVSFVARQLLDMVSPVNFGATNPLVLETTVKEHGLNLIRGMQNFQADRERSLNGLPPLGTEHFQPGVQVATTPGNVVFRNKLIELIQYAPVTPTVHAEPILIVPAWIMKYYILDLSEHNSLVRYLVSRGHTVFMISWHNPDADDRDVGMDDYLHLGVLAALDAVQAIVPDKQIDTVGYCLGGTLLSIAAAYLADKNPGLIHSVTLLAAQTDFTEAGELMLFIDTSQISYLEDSMWDKGYLDTKQMAGAFQLLQSNDLIWSKVTQEYLMGNRPAMNDMMAWNADATRMPYRMHSEYLRRLFLNNDLFEGRYRVGGRPVILGDIRLPMFVVGTENDHVAPWKSVYKIKLATDTDVSFVLTSGGHNAGIISEPGHPGRHFRYSTAKEQDSYVDPDSWLKTTPIQTGSWWLIWADWLANNASDQVAPPASGAKNKGYPPLEAAPGRYILER